jgi:hypothetical protein
MGPRPREVAADNVAAARPDGEQKTFRFPFETPRDGSSLPHSLCDLGAANSAFSVTRYGLPAREP